MKILKILKVVIFLVLSTVGFLGCGNSSDDSSTTEKKVVKLGINGDENVIWENVRDQLAKENIELKFINFADYIRPNLALQDKEIDINAFQTEI